MIIYIREAHPLDGILPERQSGVWLAGAPERRIFIEDPITPEERLLLARHCAEEMDLGFPMVVDGLDDAVNQAYAAWPERLYLVDVDGTVVYQGGKGPTDYRPKQFEDAIAELVSFYEGTLPSPR